MRQALAPHAARSSLRGRVARGFTLIEIMIVVAIISILAAVAIPSYRDYILRGQLVDATTLLASTRANMERYYQDNRRYSSVSALILAPCDARVPEAQRRQGKFVVTCSVLNDTAFTLLATGDTAIAGFSYSIDQAETRRTVSVGTGWTVPNPNTCWAVKRGQTC